MTTEYGVFNDEGCLEAGMWSVAEAEQRAAEYRADDEGDEDAKAHELCPEHDGRNGDGTEPQPKNGCELCDEAEVAEDACLDGAGEEWPEHDFSARGGDECRRCGAEAAA